MEGLETVYNLHHKSRGKNFTILASARSCFLKKHIGTGKKVLDIGCRDGQLTSMYASGNDITGADIDSSALDRAKEKIPNMQICHMDLNKHWNFPKTTYDVVVSCEFLEHIYFPEIVIHKVFEVLKPGGIFVGTVPHAYSLQSRIKFLLGIKRGTPLSDPTHINHFIFSEFKKILEKEFEIIEIIGYVPSRYKFLSKLFPYLFSEMILFSVRKLK